MPVEALACPNCGAPLPLLNGKTIVACLYCASVVRVREHEAPVRLESTFTPDHMEKIKELALNGQRDEAIQAYQQATHSDLKEAEEVVDGIIDDITRKTFTHLRLNRRGWLTLTAYTLGFIATLVLGISGTVPWYATVPLGLFALLNMVVLGRGAVVVFKYRNASVAPATILNYTHIGQMKTWNSSMHAIRVYIDVQPANQPALRVEMMLPVHDKSIIKLKIGMQMMVKYFPDDLNSFIFTKLFED